MNKPGEAGAAIDCMEAARWSLPMALAWIITRDANRVANFSDSYRESICARRATYTAARIELQSTGKAESELKRRLEARLVQAIATRESDGATVEVPAAEWDRLKICDDGDTGRDYLCLEDDVFTRVYTRIMLPRAELLKEWPAQSKWRNTSAAETEKRNWLAAQIALSPERQTILKADFLAECEAQDMPTRAAIRVWNMCVKPYPKWRRKGPPGPRKGSAAAS